MYVTGPNNCWVGAFPRRPRTFLTLSVCISAGGLISQTIIFDSFVFGTIFVFCLITAFLLFMRFEMKDAHEKLKALHMPITPNGMLSLVLRKKRLKMTSGSNEGVPALTF